MPEISVGDTGRTLDMSHEVISDFLICVPILMLYSSVHMIIVSARTESTSMARILVGPMPYTSQFVLPETTFKFYNQECGVILITRL
jgi:hypothetical protein